jgi:ATP-dependent RNA helicase DDX3X
MSTWGMPQVAAALPDATAAPTVEASAEQSTGPQDGTQGSADAGADKPKNPQEHGWAVKKEYDYTSFMKTSKELADEAAAQGSGDNGVEVGGWASNAAIYEWNEDFGDVGPAYPDLEKQLFGSETHVRAGIEFEK